MVRPKNCLRVSTQANTSANGRHKSTLRVATLKLKISASLSLALSHIIVSSRYGASCLTQYTVRSPELEDLINVLFSRGGIRHGVPGTLDGEPDWRSAGQLGHAGRAYLFRRPALFARILERPPRHRYVTLDLAAAALWRGA